MIMDVTRAREITKGLGKKSFLADIEDTEYRIETWARRGLSSISFSSQELINEENAERIATYFTNQGFIVDIEKNKFGEHSRITIDWM